MTDPFPLPFGGSISQFFQEEAPTTIRDAIAQAGKNDMLAASYPYGKRLDRSRYEAELYALQIELAKFQAHVQKTGQRIVILFEGRDAAGKGGSIKRFRENLNPRIARVVALAKPNDLERSQIYLQRYIKHLPAAGEIVLFDRSWYNRAVVEPVFGFCSPEERALFFRQVPNFETGLIDEGIHLIKIWLDVGRAEQLRRFLDRERDPLKQWKLSQIDVDGLRKWDAYCKAISETFAMTHTSLSPWIVIRADDKRRARLAVIKSVLSRIDYAHRDDQVVTIPDSKICGGPDLFNA
ncbi:MAG: polyphosphate kinase 2 [Mangrovicoccus sp.]